MVIDAENGNSSLDSIEPKIKPLKILFLSSDTGGGHRASAEALGAQFEVLYPGSTYSLLDIMQKHSSAPFNRLVESYKHLSKHPKQWNFVYKLSNSPPVETLVKTHLKITTERRVRQAIKEHYPDVVISVHPLMTNVPVTSCQKISSESGKHLPIFTVVTDLGSGHSTWFEGGVEKIFIASQQIQELAMKRGKVPKTKLIMSGLPIRKDFTAQAGCLGDGGRNSIQGNIHQMQVRDMLGIAHNNASGAIIDGKDHNCSDHKVILVMGGGEGVGSLSSIVDCLYTELMLEGINATIAVVCGRNEKLKKSLETRDWNELLLLARQRRIKEAALKKNGGMSGLEGLKLLASMPFRALHKRAMGTIYTKEKDEKQGQEAANDSLQSVDGKPLVMVHPLGFVNNMADYMVAADILVSKAGPGTIAEAACVGLPVLLTSFLPGMYKSHNSRGN
jgi:1,2-diacylglycerol 3-beta-galactosyltransferase